MQEVVLLFLFMHVLSPCLRKTESDSSRVVIGGEECTFFVAGVETYCISDVIYCLLISCWDNRRQIGHRVAQK